MNAFYGCGNLTRDPERRSTTTGLAVASFNIAINRPVSKDKGKITDFIPVTAFGQTAELVCKYLKKGSKCIVEGTLQTSTYQGQDGNNHFKMEVVANRVEFVSMPTQNAQSAPAQQAYTSPTAPMPPMDGGYTQVDMKDDLPF